MNLDWSTVFPILQATGLPGLLIGLIVLVFVFLGDCTSVFPTGNFKRVAVVLASFLFSGAGNGDVFNLIKGAIGVVAASLLKVLLDKLFSLDTATAKVRAFLIPPK